LAFGRIKKNKDVDIARGKRFAVKSRGGGSTKGKPVRTPSSVSCSRVSQTACMIV
jgi:hypothetical protein